MKTINIDWAKKLPSNFTGIAIWPGNLDFYRTDLTRLVKLFVLNVRVKMLFKIIAVELGQGS
jgi:hypothetical protein